MNQRDVLRKGLQINQLLEGDKWVPVDALGREVAPEHAVEVEFVACKACAKQYKWNQTSWIRKHDEEHQAERKTTKVLPDTRDRVRVHTREPEKTVESPSLAVIFDKLLEVAEMVESLKHERQQEERRRA